MTTRGTFPDAHFFNMTVNGDISHTSGTTSKPVFTLENTNDDATAGTFKFLKNTSDSAAAADVIGNINFVGEDADENATDYATIVAKSSAVTAGSESGSMHFSVATTTSGALGEVLTIEGGATAATSSVTVNGTLNMLQKVTLITGAGGSTTLSATDSGTVYFVNTADAAHTFTLPALTAGFNMTLIVTVLSDNDILVTAPSDCMITATQHNDANGDAANKIVTDTYTTVTINADTVNAVVGTRVDIFCDGTNYFYYGMSSAQSDSDMFVGS